MIIIGLLMMVGGGVIIPLLMVIRVLESTFLLIFGSYGISVAGLFLGIIGVAQYVQLGKKNR